ncbi:MAG: ATP-grasp domain-containing protein [Anaerolineae bacterium]|nr:ATP-grasp domain-containing protein [Anaerolineae bacterium]NUQ03421.1 ATP-grasp domain-containing protein [Anaerolineae bacterium]
MIRTLLIANRGEVAVRICRTCRDLGIATVAVYSDADAESPHARAADEAVRIGPAPAAESYLNIPAILDATQRSGADAVHPGFGFLAENAAFAQAVIDAGLTWVGPTPAAIAAMGDKRRAKRLLRDIPVVPGYSGEDQSDAALAMAADEIGVPLLVKAAAGGGGKGMRRVDDLADFASALRGARREAERAFGDGTLILERYVAQPRHVEIQILGDRHGAVIALGERECSIQRRHQKIIEETPSPAVDDALRARMSAAAVSIGQQLGYVSAGTVEFLLDADGQFYFIEMNTRLQVEHPVTELVYGVDLVAIQLQIAEGAALGDLLPRVERRGHAVEARIYAEDPANDFLPSTGSVQRWTAPTGAGIRVDSGIETGGEVTVHYDPMIAKIIAHAPTRAEALRRLDHALGETVLLGLRHNIAFLRRVLRHPEFAAGAFDTDFLARQPVLSMPASDPPLHAVIGAALRCADLGTERFRNNPYRPQRQTLRHGDRSFEVLIDRAGGGAFRVTLDGAARIARWSGENRLTLDGHTRRVEIVRSGTALWTQIDSEVLALEWIDPLPAGQAVRESAGSLRAPMPGQIIKVEAEIGQFVLKGTILLVMEAMKMEHRISAPYDGTVTAIHFNQGQTVQQGVTLIDLQASNPS